MDFRNLRVYKIAINFTKEIYELSKEIPEYEQFGLVSQLRRAVVSIVLNIAEGCGCGSDIEFSRFLKFSIKSLLRSRCYIRAHG